MLATWIKCYHSSESEEGTNIQMEKISIKKIKLASEHRHDCEDFDFTTSAEVEETESTKRKHKKRKYEDSMTENALSSAIQGDLRDDRPVEQSRASDEEVLMPTPPVKLQHTEPEAQGSGNKTRQRKKHTKGTAHNESSSDEDKPLKSAPQSQSPPWSISLLEKGHLMKIRIQNLLLSQKTSSVYHIRVHLTKTNI